ncbi:unnamed protein product [Rhodiola kirilowii]
MILLSWNCRGLGHPRAVRSARDLIRSYSYRPEVFGLIETKLKARDWEFTRIKLGFQHCFSFGRVGLSGGLALLWNEETEVKVKSYSRYHIDAEVGNHEVFNFTLFYGNPRASLREESWNLLRAIRNTVRDEWLVMGDFNEILFSWEMKG